MPDDPARSSVRGALALAATVFLLLLLKNPDMLRWPPLHAEDGSQMLAYYYCPRGPGSVLRFYNGYVSLMPNAIGYLALRAPIEIAPTLLAVVPFVIGGLCLMLPWLLKLYGPAASGSAAAATLLLAALPLGSAPLVANTTYSFWNGLLGLSLLVLAPPAGRWPGLLARVLVASLLLASHPLSVVVLPLLLVSLLREVWGRSPRMGWTALLILVGVGYQMAWVVREAVRARPPGTILRLGLRYLSERVAFEALLGSEARVWLHANGLGWLVATLGALLAAGIGLLCWRRLRSEPGMAGPLLGLGYLIAAITFGVVVGRNVRTGLLWSYFGEHYFYVPKALLWLALVFGATPVVARLGASGRRVVVALLCVYALGLGWVERGRYDVSADEGRRVAAFVKEVAGLEEARGGRRGIEIALERTDGSRLRLYAPAQNQPCED